MEWWTRLPGSIPPLFGTLLVQIIQGEVLPTSQTLLNTLNTSRYYLSVGVAGYSQFSFSVALDVTAPGVKRTQKIEISHFRKY